jgi:glycosyltransferase involved in cell wall biosynthesis
VAPYTELQALAGRYVYILRSGTPGPAASRNMGMAVADSRYILFLDDDDSFEPDHLALLAQHLQHTDPALLVCDFQVRHEDRRLTPPQPLSTATVSLADVTDDSVFVRNRIPNSCIAYRRDVVTHLRHDANLQLYEDWDFLLQCLASHRLSHVASPGVLIHKSNADAPQNLRRGNCSDDKIVEVMLALYRRHPAPNAATRGARQALLASAGIAVGLEQC